MELLRTNLRGNAKCMFLTRKYTVDFVSCCLILLQLIPQLNGANQLTHIRNPVRLSVGECVSFKASPAHDAVGNWTWRKDTIDMRSSRIVVAGSNRITTNKNVLRIRDVQLEDSAFYSAEVQTKERMELFKFWLNVQGCKPNEKKNSYFQGSCNSWCQEKCDDGWSHFDGNCYKYFGEINSWETALDNCLSQDAELAAVHDKKTNEFVSSLLESGEGAWLGLSDRAKESVYVWNNDQDDKATYFQWAKNEPSNTNSVCNIENCVEMRYPNRKWNDMVCNGYNAYVCQISKDKLNDSLSWSCHGSRCYKYFRTEVIWKDARMNCELLGGELVRITDATINNVVGTLVTTNVWIGLNDIAEPGVYVWNDFEVGKLSDKASYFNWDVGEPNDKLYDILWRGKCSGEDCVQMSYNSENVVTWSDRECSKKLPYVCQKRRDGFLTLAAALGIAGGCTAVSIIIAVLVQSRLKKHKHKVQLQRLVFDVTRYNKPALS